MLLQLLLFENLFFEPGSHSNSVDDEPLLFSFLWPLQDDLFSSSVLPFVFDCRLITVRILCSAMHRYPCPSLACMDRECWQRHLYCQLQCSFLVLANWLRKWPMSHSRLLLPLFLCGVFLCWLSLSHHPFYSDTIAFFFFFAFKYWLSSSFSL